MIASFITKPTPNVELLHAVFSVAREGFKVAAHGYCSAATNAGEGTYQVPDWAFDGRPIYQPMANVTWNVCPKCAEVMKRLREPPPPR